MADENTENEEEMDDDEISWEDAFAEAAGEHEDDEPIHEPVLATQDGGATRGEQPLAGSQGGAPGKVDIDFLLDIPLDVTVEIGRKRILINDLLQMQQGSVITLDKMVGESFEVLVNGKLMALGEVVMINEKFGIRLTDVIDPRERLEKLT